MKSSKHMDCSILLLSQTTENSAANSKAILSNNSLSAGSAVIAIRVVMSRQNPY
jgi:hypothetical protein